MPFQVPITDAAKQFPEYKFVRALTPSEQKAAFEVTDSEGRRLCLKIICPNYSLDRLQREIIALQATTHPNVVLLKEYTYSTKTGHSRHFLVEEFIEGDDLATHLSPGKQWTLKKAAGMFAQLADGLAALAKVRVVHRDLKPQNIRVRTDGSPVIIDFGLSRHLELPDLTNTADGAAVGTPLYFAPEQFAGTKHDIDTRTDLFAFGVLLFQALTGHYPWTATPTTVTYAQLKDLVCKSGTFENQPQFAALPPKWKVLLRKLLERARAARPTDAGQVAAILHKLEAEA